MKERLIEFDIIQGLAMVLVVLGHHLFDFMPQWYHELHYFLYIFHMPLFIFISGFLIEYSYKGVTNLCEYKRYIGRKAKKFIPMYFFVGVITIFLTIGVNDHILFFKQLLYLLISPKEGQAVFLWYIYLLFFYYCLFPLISNLNIIGYATCLLVFFYGFISPIKTNIFCLDYFTEYSVFFLLGILMAKVYIDRIKYFKILSFVTIFPFLILSVYHFLSGYNPILEYILPWLAIPSFYGFSLMIKKNRIVSNVFIYISINCFSIYLFHMFIVQVVALPTKLLAFNMTTFEYCLYLIFSLSFSIFCSSKVYGCLKKVLKIMSL